MSVIFGIRKTEGALVEGRQLLDLAHATNRYALDGTFVRAKGSVGMGFQSYRTHQRADLESQPFLDDFGNMVSLDGRLDNHKELRELLDIPGTDTADSLIILTAFRCWGEECFARFVGDWALALWIQENSSLYLARDHAGTRTLYFEETNGHLVWSTFLETFFADRRSRPLDETYAARYLSCHPIGDLTPFANIAAVTPAHYFIFSKGTIVRRPHWQWMVKDRITYNQDSEYEEHFLKLFAQAVDRRTGPGAPILAHLSGGMDSSAIVCMSDTLRLHQGRQIEQLLDTVSFYDDSEPAWDEKPYFTAVESQRGKVGLHVDVSSTRPTFTPLSCPPGGYPLLPGNDGGSYEQREHFEEILASRGYRVLLSGVGGDELLGGVPTPLPELSDYLLTCNLAALFQKTLPWCLSLRTSLLHLVRDTVRFSKRAYWSGSSGKIHLPPWASPRLEPNEADAKQEGGLLLPSRVMNGRTWWSILETLPSPHLASSRREYRFPYLDRDLVDFLLRIPNDQLVRPGRRRALMRRALSGILPSIVLERRRKAYIDRGPAVTLALSTDTILDSVANSLLARHGYIDIPKFESFLRQVGSQDQSRWGLSLMRTSLFEIWLKSGWATIP
ncbi:asparagine synthase-related protein [Tunturibacter empetritectus]|uniref:asparagine synthase (glutamine-hydrolyzing) n=1 Tax=Tunturiibacter empetritectus TaxID=3069691 RepID=A0AAU7ZFS6_9BACT